MGILITLTDSADQQTQHRIAFTVPCPILVSDFNAVSAFMPFELVDIATTTGIESLNAVSYQGIYDKILQQLNYNANARSTCGIIKLNFVNSLSELSHDPIKHTVTLTSGLNSVDGTYYDSYIEFKFLAFTWRLKIQARLVSCQVASLNFKEPYR